MVNAGNIAHLGNSHSEGFYPGNAVIATAYNSEKKFS
jgi:hypothetical protein